MVGYKRFHLNNGLTVIIHEDRNTPMAVTNLMYNVGSRDEHPDKTGYAHLFEHLMFGGSINIPDFDTPLHRAGGHSNAGTSADYTEYTIKIPSDNIETALWLESDRMLGLALNETVLDTQKKVVAEEFKEHYLERPYGDVPFLLNKLAYKVHPYQWLTIGKSIEHIHQMKLEDVASFFNKFYCPANAILVIAGNIDTDTICRLVEKWFGTIHPGQKYIRSIPAEPALQQARMEDAIGNAPIDALYKCFPMAARDSDGYYTTALITGILGNGTSSRLYQELVREKKVFSNIMSMISNTIDPGLLQIHAQLAKGVSMTEANGALEDLLQKFVCTGATHLELETITNMVESTFESSHLRIDQKATELALYESLGKPELINTEPEKYYANTPEDIQSVSRQLFAKDNSITLNYYSKKD